MQESFPVVGGRVVDALLAPISGEFRIGSEFLLSDIPLVALSPLVGLAAWRAARRTATAPRRPGL